MAVDTLFERFVGGNVAKPQLTDPKISSHEMAAMIALLASGEFSTYTPDAKQAIIDAFDLTETSDSATLDSIHQAYKDAADAGLGSLWLEFFEHRIVLARNKRSPASQGLNGMNGIHGYATDIATFLAGYDGAHNLRTTGISPPAEQFTSWAPNAVGPA